MFNRLHKNESGQNALETAIILIAFIVVASVFAFAILSAGQASTEKGEQAIYAGLEGVQSSMSIKGAVIAEAAAAGAAAPVVSVSFTVALVAGGEPVDLNTTAKKVVISYRDGVNIDNNLDWAVEWIVNNDGGTADDMLEDGELAELKVTLPAGKLLANTAFTLEVKPPTGSVLVINRTTPPSVEKVMELR